ncbi:hypothetical protein J6590_075044 [Homalodisca vitripennis]|nr:hypothetical protein J6590_075044 [Homalodisca vitripennis]
MENQTPLTGSESRFGDYSEEKCIVNNQYYSYLLLRKVKRAMKEKIRKFMDLREEV